MDYFTSGRFAKICSVTKKALYHYEKKGLLSAVKKAWSFMSRQL